MRRWLIASVLGCALCATAVSARGADPPDLAKVEELKQRGNQAMMDLRYSDAIEAYRAALAIAPDDAALYYNLGRAEQARESFPEALDALEEFVKRASPEVRARVPKLDDLVADVRTRVAAVSVRCSVDIVDAKVVVGDRKAITGCTKAARIVRFGVPARTASIEVSLASGEWQAQPQRVDVAGGAPPTDVLFAVLPRSTSGRLVVRASPASATISVDGIARGNALLEMPLAAGQHTIDVDAARYEPVRLVVSVDVGKTKDVPVTLEAKTPLTSKWWFWAGVGAVVVIAGVTTWYLVAQPERDSTAKGSIDPGKYSVPLVRY